MDPLEIETLVTLPIESALNGSVGVRRVRSATAVGVAVVWVEFDWGRDITRARQTVESRWKLIRQHVTEFLRAKRLRPFRRREPARSWDMWWRGKSHSHW